MYIEDDNFFSNLKHSDYLSFFNLNVQSLPAKFNELKDLLFSLKLNFDVICLQEIWQIPDDELFKLPGYKFIHKSRDNNVQGGGIGIYVKEEYSFRIIPEYSIFLDKIIESLFVEIELGSKQKVVVSSVYRPNSVHATLSGTQQLDQFTEMFLNVLNDISATHKTAYIMGDFNIDLLKCNSNAKTSEFIENCFSNGFIELVIKPTRCQKKSATLIDHFFTNDLKPKTVCGIYCSKLSDHFPICTFVPMKKSRKKPKYLKSRSCNTESIERFKSALENVNWNEVLMSSNSQESYDIFSSIFDELISLFFPEKNC